jgi:hypothetical protein
MADIKISELTAKAAAMAVTDEFEINEVGVSKKITGANIVSGVKADSDVLLASTMDTAGKAQAYNANITTVAASLAEMQSGTSTDLRSMSPLRVQQNVDTNVTALADGSKGAIVQNAALAGYPFTTPIPAGWELLDSWVPTAVASKDFTWDESLYTDIMIVTEGIIPATDNSVSRIQLGHTNGTVFLTGTADYSIRGEVVNSAFVPTYGNRRFNNSSISLSLHEYTGDLFSEWGVGTAAGEGISSTITLSGMASALNQPVARFISAFKDSVGINWACSGIATCQDGSADTAIFDAVRLLWSTGNFEAAGKVYVYGLKRA